MLSLEKSLTIIISKFWKDWFIILKAALSIYFSVLYAGMHTDIKGYLSLIVFLLYINKFS